jgi:hypothetical protein
MLNQLGDHREYSVHCSEQSGSCLVYFYFPFRDAEKQEIGNLLRSILGQLVRTSGPRGVAKALYENYQHNQPPTDQLMPAAKSMQSDAGEVYILMDALDECPEKNGERSELFAMLQDILEWKKQNVHILVVSRKENDLNETLEPLRTMPHLLESRIIDEDTEKFSKFSSLLIES